VHLSYRLNLPTDDRHVSVVRRLAVGTLTELEVDQDCIDDIALALTEACANVVQHGQDAGDFEVEVAVDAETCRITIRESGGAFTGEAPPQAPAEAPAEAPADAEPLTHGRGIGLMRLLVDQLRYVPDADGTTVVLVKELSLRPGSVLTGP
jgi:serine/threonine-protein kinase RsbW